MLLLFDLEYILDLYLLNWQQINERGSDKTDIKASNQLLRKNHLKNT